MERVGRNRPRYGNDGKQQEARTGGSENKKDTDKKDTKGKGRMQDHEDRGEQGKKELGMEDSVHAPRIEKTATTTQQLAEIVAEEAFEDTQMKEGRPSRDHLFKECKAWEKEIKELWTTVGKIAGKREEGDGPFKSRRGVCVILYLISRYMRP